MKRITSRALTVGLLATSTVLGASVFSPAFAVPNLQLDILGGNYDSVDQSIVNATNPFTLYAYCQNKLNSSNCLVDTFKVSLAILFNGQSILAGTNFGSFTFNGTTYGTGGNALTFGTPPLDTNVIDGDLPTHSIFPTLFAEQSFTFSSQQTRSSVNTQDTPGTNPLGNLGTDLYYQGFSADVSGLNAGYRLHFDLYSVTGIGNLDIKNFAPFSHDAYAENHTQTKVPEPGLTAALGFLGLVSLRSLKRRKALSNAQSNPIFRGS